MLLATGSLMLLSTPLTLKRHSSAASMVGMDTLRHLRCGRVDRTHGTLLTPHRASSRKLLLVVSLHGKTAMCRLTSRRLWREVGSNRSLPVSALQRGFKIIGATAQLSICGGGHLVTQSRFTWMQRMAPSASCVAKSVLYSSRRPAGAISTRFPCRRQGCHGRLPRSSSRSPTSPPSHASSMPSSTVWRSCCKRARFALLASPHLIPSTHISPRPLTLQVLFIPACCAHEITGEMTLIDGSPAEHVLSVNRFWRTDPNLVRKHMPDDSLRSYNEEMAIFE